MPLLPGKNEIGHNVKEMEAAGHSHAQSVAAALREAYDAHAAGIILRSSQGRALFLRRSDKSRDHAGEWCCPGGSIEAGETPEQAARREAQEEAGYPAGELTQIDEGDGFVTFQADVAEEFEPTLNEEHVEFRWAPMDTPPEPTHPGVLATLRKLLEKAAEAGQEEAQTQRQAQALLATDALDRREYDTNGWFEVKDNPLSKVGVYQYSEASVVKGGDRNKMVGVYRPAEELGSEECLKSFKLMPWTDDHPSTLLGPEEQGLVPAEKKGVHGVIGEQVYFRDGTLYGNIKVFSESLAKKIAAGKRELSCGYHCDFIPQEGVHEGIPYQYVQRNMRGNHFSSVPKGRMGSEVRVLDAADAPNSEFAAATRFTFSLDMRETAMPESKRDDEIKDCVDADTLQFIGDSFNSLVGELEKKGYSKEYATKIAGKVAAEKGMTGHHDSKDKVTTMPAADATTKTEEELKRESADRRAARDSKRSARDAMRAKDMSAEEEEAEDAREAAEDAEEEKEDEKDESKEAKDRKSARDRRMGARDARKGARDRKAAKDAEEKEKKEAAKDKGMDAAEVAALVEQKVRDVAPAMRREAAAVHKLYQRLSPVIGAFDHDEMSVTEMAAYGLKKLGAPEAKTDPVTALDFYLAGRAQAQPEPRIRSAAHDASDASFVGKYLNS